MIRGILLIFNPVGNWDKIAKAQRGFWFIFIFHLLPVMIVTLGLETWMITRFGERTRMTNQVGQISQQLAIDYGATEFVLNLVLIFLGSLLIQKVGVNFHGQPTFRQCFTLLAYGLTPLFYAHVIDGFPLVPTWVCFSIGMVLSIMLLYQGMPRLMEPDPTSGLGLYISISLLVALLAGVVHLVAVFVLQQQLNARFWEAFTVF